GHRALGARLQGTAGREVRRVILAEVLDPERAADLVAEASASLRPLQRHADREKALRTEVAAMTVGEVAQVLVIADAGDVEPGGQFAVSGLPEIRVRAEAALDARVRHHILPLQGMPAAIPVLAIVRAIETQVQ